MGNVSIFEMDLVRSLPNSVFIFLDDFKRPSKFHDFYLVSDLKLAPHNTREISIKLNSTVAVVRLKRCRNSLSLRVKLRSDLRHNIYNSSDLYFSSTCCQEETSLDLDFCFPLDDP